MCGGWLISRDSKHIIIFQDKGRFSEKPIQSLIYWVHRLQISKIHLVWCLMGNDLAFRDFYRRKFPTFSMGGAMRLNFGKILGYLVEFVSRKGIFYLLVFVDISNSCFWTSLPIYNLESLICHFLKFLECELVVILLDLNSLDLPESVPYFLRYAISAIHVRL